MPDKVANVVLSSYLRIIPEFINARIPKNVWQCYFGLVLPY